MPLFLHQARPRVKQQVVISSYAARELRSYIDWAARVTLMSAEEVMARIVDHALAEHFKRDKLWRLERQVALAASAE
jgi:hypothetical protein